MTHSDLHASELAAELRRQHKLLEESQAQIDRITATATARDRSVAVEANAAGHILSVEIFTRSHDNSAIGAAITVCANQAIQAAQEAAEEQMADFFDAQAAAVDYLAERTGVDLSETVRAESRPPAVPEHWLTERAFREFRQAR